MLSVFVVGTSGANDKEVSLEEVKANRLKHLDERIAEIQKTKDCVNQAQSIEAIKTCKADHRERVKERHGRAKHHKKG